MLGSKRFGDVRFALYTHMSFPMICMKRRAHWLDEPQAGESVFETFTKDSPDQVISQAQATAGFHQLNANAAKDCGLSKVLPWRPFRLPQI